MLTSARPPLPPFADTAPNNQPQIAKQVSEFSFRASFGVASSSAHSSATQTALRAITKAVPELAALPSAAVARICNAVRGGVLPKPPATPRPL